MSNQILKGMKKILFLLTIARALASCSTNEVSDVNDLAKNGEITFSTLRDKVETRAANDDSEDYQVYAVIEGGTTWFINEEYGGTSNDPISGNKYLWPGNGKTVSFYAFCPSSSVTGSGITVGDTDVSTPSIPITYTVSADGNEDFTIAAPVLNQSADLVELEFSHVLSKVSVTATLSQELTTAGYTIKEGYTSTLTLLYNTSTINAADDSPTWGTLSATSIDPYTEAATYIIMPQSTSGCSVQITGITILAKDGSEIFNGDLKSYTFSADNTVLSEFKQGNYYILSFEITNTATDSGNQDVFGDEIQFSASMVDWESETGSTVDITQP